MPIGRMQVRDDLSRAFGQSLAVNSSQRLGSCCAKEDVPDKSSSSSKSLMIVWLFISRRNLRKITGPSFRCSISAARSFIQMHKGYIHSQGSRPYIISGWHTREASPGNSPARLTPCPPFPTRTRSWRHYSNIVHHYI